MRYVIQLHKKLTGYYRLIVEIGMGPKQSPLYRTFLTPTSVPDSHFENINQQLMSSSENETLLPRVVQLGLAEKPWDCDSCTNSILEGALRESSGLGVELLPGARLTGMKYADDIVLLSPSAEDMQTMLNKMSDRADNSLETVDSFTYLGSTISSACNIADEISARIAKAPVAFSKLRHLWRRKDVRLSLKGRVYNACVRSILLYGSETWPVRKQDINRLAVFDHRCLRHLAHIKWADRVSNAAVRRRVFRNARDARSIDQLITLHSLQWLGHVLRMPAEILSYQALYTEATNSWVKPRGGQATTWSRNMMITLTAPVSKVSSDFDESAVLPQQNLDSLVNGTSELLLVYLRHQAILLEATS
ncbi:uncharacterized protein DEA37_0005169 [Paragonimus westermani]|uniref:Reverse transcriptase domain-containing protein n=1 Tax=Paragonimus westermani TaxID=34504 RepID=A0A5J4NYW4_9TREM|nr:uncharacterized protein DEA37_0005169 [Paragonimus westermani]